MKLSILIPTIHTRRNTFLPRILEQLYSQYDKLTESEQKQVEILVLMDNKTLVLGDKRNSLIELAQGKYVSFVDDDDRVSDDYIKSILDATNEDNDTITFNSEVRLNQEASKICYFSNKFKEDNNKPDLYERTPNHICAIKRDIAKKVKFPSKIFKEDVDYSQKIRPLIKTETKIPRVLYYYDFNTETTETQTSTRKRADYKKPTVEIPAILDIVILSNAKIEQFRQMTETTIRTALETSRGYNLNIIVMEQQDHINYANAQTIHYDGEFNYNAVANLGISKGKAPYIMVANNDLVFKPDWLFHLLKANHNIVSPKCPIDFRQKGIKENTKGYEVAKHFSGWCFMMKRHIWEEIDGLDEDFGFWFSDNATVKQVQALGYIPMIVPDALVEHLGSRTLQTLNPQKQKEYTKDLIQKFNKKYNERQFQK